MVDLTLAAVAWTLLGLVSVGFAGIGLLVYRREEFPGVTSFAAYCILLGVGAGAWTAGEVLEQLPPALAGALPQVVLLALGITILLTYLAAGMTAPLFWLRFVLAYTGQRVPVTRRTLLALGAPIGLALGSVTAGLFLTLLLPNYPTLNSALQTWSEYVVAMNVFYLGALLVAGAALIAWTSYRHRYLSTRGGVLLSVGSVLPWASFAIPQTAGLLQANELFLDYHTAAFGAVGLAAVWTAVFRYSLFADIPAAGTVGRDGTVEDMDDAMVVVDDDHRIVDLNPAAERLFSVSDNAVGSPVSTLDRALDRDAIDDRWEFELDDGQRTISSTGSQLEDEYGRTIGYSVVCRDVTERRRREQRIEVMNRVLRHNLRNDLTAVKGYAALLEDAPSDPETYAAQIQETADGLMATGDKAREVEEVVATEDNRTAPLSDVVQQAVSDVRSGAPDATITTALPEADPLVDDVVLMPVVRELVENGVSHSDADAPRVEATATVDETAAYPVEIAVTDNGPGIPDHELAPIRQGGETDLEHGSGIGLWLVHWGVASVDGRVEFETGADGGTTATVRLPGTASGSAEP